MFTQKKEGFEGTTVIAEGVRVEGDFAGVGAMIIDGTVVGTIATDQSVEVGQSARIEANIKAGAVVVAGHIKGNILARERLELLPGSRVEGDISTKTLIIAEGSSLNGKCNMGGNETAKQSAKEAKETAAQSKRQTAVVQ